MRGGALRSLILAILLSVSAHAENVHPSIVPLREGYEQEIAALANARGTRISELTASYVKLLDDAAASATDAVVAGAVRKEREGIATGFLAPGRIPGLPPEIEAAHRKFFGAVSQASVDFETAKKKVDAAYLKVLTALTAKGRRDAALARDAAAEKRRVINGAP